MWTPKDWTGHTGGVYSIPISKRLISDDKNSTAQVVQPARHSEGEALANCEEEINNSGSKAEPKAAYVHQIIDTQINS